MTSSDSGLGTTATAQKWCSAALSGLGTVTELPSYTKLSKKIIQQANDLANLSPYNPVVHEITMDFKPIHIPAKIVISLAITITSYIKVRITKYIRV
jgi:hypothetical protein